MELQPPINSPLFSAFRWISWIVLALMVAGILYAAWLAASNWHSISV